MTILDYALYVAGALLTISAAGAVLCKWVKKAISAAIHEDMEEFNLDSSTASFVIFFLILSLFILIAYPIMIIGLFQSDD